MSKRKAHPHPVLQPLNAERPPMRVLLLYAAGQLGWSLAAFSVTNLLIYFYMPPETGQAVFPTFIYQGSVLGVLTLIGMLSAGGRLMDALIDPLIANWSDRSENTKGKRRWFMLRGALPFALSGFLVFYPLGASESASNFMWLGLCVAVFYFFFAFYVIPYTALIAELGHNPQDRMRISTYLSVAWALGFILGNSSYALQSYFEKTGTLPLQAFQVSMAILHGIALIFMLLPALFLQEKKYARQGVSTHKLRQSLLAVLGNRNFRHFLLSDLMYWLALNFIQLGIGFYTTVMLGLDKAYAFGFSLVSFLCSFLFYLPINKLAVRTGKRRLVLTSFVLFAVLFAAVGFIRFLPGPREWLLYGFAVAASFPLAVFGIIPNALIGDEVEKEEHASGRQLAGMFYGVRAFVMKVGISLANLIFPSLLLFGKSTSDPDGVQLTALFAVVISMAGWAAFRRYREIGY